MRLLPDRAKDIPTSIKAPVTNLTLGSGAAALIAAAVTTYNDSFKTIFGDNATDVTKRHVLLGIIFAFVAVAVADIFSRAIVTAAHEHANGAVATAAVGHAGVTALLPAQDATLKSGTDSPGYTAIAMRSDSPSTRSYLVIKADHTPQWVTEENLELEPAANGHAGA